MRLSHRVFYAAGPGNIIAAHGHWSRGSHDPTEVSITFSSQVEDFCRDTNSTAYFVSAKAPAQNLTDGAITLEHRPKPMQGARGLRYHFAEAVYAWGLLRTARKFKATVTVLDSGTSHFFMGWLFRVAGIPVVTVLHNTIWPSGFPPNKLVPKLIHRLNALFFRWGSSANIGVSPECTRQVAEITTGRHGPLYEIRAQFLPDRFETIKPPPAFDGSLLRIMYMGRINRFKGVFDILGMAKRIEEVVPGRVQWDICGTGPDFEELKVQHAAMRLTNVQLLGWILPDQLQEVYNRNHISIIPTRSDFAEGLAMTAAEAILAGRPIISNPVVPALEILRPASLSGRTDDIGSYIKAIHGLLKDPALYTRLCENCLPLQAQFYDRRKGLAAALSSILGRANYGTVIPNSAEETARDQRYLAGL